MRPGISTTYLVVLDGLILRPLDWVDSFSQVERVWGVAQFSGCALKVLVSAVASEMQRNHH